MAPAHRTSYEILCLPSLFPFRPACSLPSVSRILLCGDALLFLSGLKDQRSEIGPCTSTVCLILLFLCNLLALSLCFSDSFGSIRVFFFFALSSHHTHNTLKYIVHYPIIVKEKHICMCKTMEIYLSLSSVTSSAIFWNPISSNLMARPPLHRVTIHCISWAFSFISDLIFGRDV